MFPFTYYENLHYSCTTDGDPEGLEWCATQTRAGDNYPLVWGHCSPGCREIVSSYDNEAPSTPNDNGDIMNDDEGRMDSFDHGKIMDSLRCFTTDGNDQGTEHNLFHLKVMKT